jgi:hypothetical protein
MHRIDKGPAAAAFLPIMHHESNPIQSVFLLGVPRARRARNGLTDERFAERETTGDAGDEEASGDAQGGG